MKGYAYANDNANAKLVDSDLGDEHGNHGKHGKKYKDNNVVNVFDNDRQYKI